MNHYISISESHLLTIERYHLIKSFAMTFVIQFYDLENPNYTYPPQLVAPMKTELMSAGLEGEAVQKVREYTYPTPFFTSQCSFQGMVTWLTW